MTEPTTYVGAQVVLDDRVLREDGWLTHAGGVITAVGHRDGPKPPELAGGRVIDLDGGWVIPGFVDAHVHGGGGHSIVGGDPGDARAALEFHRRHGTTTASLSLVSRPVDELAGMVASLAGLVEELRRPEGTPGLAAGIHLEGPFLATSACGAHDPRALVAPTPAHVRTVLAAGRGTVRMVTIAPELDGALPAIGQFVAAGVVVAVGHTAATAEQTSAAFDRGASAVTHLFNAMTGLHHRAPGVVGAALADPRVICELILDGHHVDPSVAAVAIAAAGPDRIALVTDAIAAAGAGDGVHQLGSRVVDVVDGVARVRDSGALAGSTLTMESAFAGALTLGFDVPAASRMTSAVPARMLGLDGSCGRISVNRPADLVLLDRAGALTAVIAGGQQIKRDHDHSPFTKG